MRYTGLDFMRLTANRRGSKRLGSGISVGPGVGRSLGQVTVQLEVRVGAQNRARAELSL